MPGKNYLSYDQLYDYVSKNKGGDLTKDQFAQDMTDVSKRYRLFKNAKDGGVAEIPSDFKDFGDFYKFDTPPKPAATPATEQQAAAGAQGQQTAEAKQNIDPNFYVAPTNTTINQAMSGFQGHPQDNPAFVAEVQKQKKQLQDQFKVSTGLYKTSKTDPNQVIPVQQDPKKFKEQYDKTAVDFFKSPQVLDAARLSDGEKSVVNAGLVESYYNAPDEANRQAYLKRITDLIPGWNPLPQDQWNILNENKGGVWESNAATMHHVQDEFKNPLSQAANYFTSMVGGDDLQKHYDEAVQQSSIFSRAYLLGEQPSKETAGTDLTQGTNQGLNTVTRLLTTGMFPKYTTQEEYQQEVNNFLSQGIAKNIAKANPDISSDDLDKQTNEQLKGLTTTLQKEELNPTFLRTVSQATGNMIGMLPAWELTKMMGEGSTINFTSKMAASDDVVQAVTGKVLQKTISNAVPMAAIDEKHLRGFGTGMMFGAFGELGDKLGVQLSSKFGDFWTPAAKYLMAPVVQGASTASAQTLQDVVSALSGSPDFKQELKDKGLGDWVSDQGRSWLANATTFTMFGAVTHAVDPSDYKALIQDFKAEQARTRDKKEKAKLQQMQADVEATNAAMQKTAQQPENVNHTITDKFNTTQGHNLPPVNTTKEIPDGQPISTNKIDTENQSINVPPKDVTNPDDAFTHLQAQISNENGTGISETTIKGHKNASDIIDQLNKNNIGYSVSKIGDPKDPQYHIIAFKQDHTSAAGAKTLSDLRAKQAADPKSITPDDLATIAGLVGNDPVETLNNHADDASSQGHQPLAEQLKTTATDITSAKDNNEGKNNIIEKSNMITMLQKANTYSPQSMRNVEADMTEYCAKFGYTWNYDANGRVVVKDKSGNIVTDSEKDTQPQYNVEKSSDLQEAVNEHAQAKGTDKAASYDKAQALAKTQGLKLDLKYFGETGRLRYGNNNNPNVLQPTVGYKQLKEYTPEFQKFISEGGLGKAANLFTGKDKTFAGFKESDLEGMLHNIVNGNFDHNTEKFLGAFEKEHAKPEIADAPDKPIAKAPADVKKPDFTKADAADVPADKLPGAMKKLAEQKDQQKKFDKMPAVKQQAIDKYIDEVMSGQRQPTDAEKAMASDPKNADIIEQRASNKATPAIAESKEPVSNDPPLPPSEVKGNPEGSQSRTDKPSSAEGFVSMPITDIKKALTDFQGRSTEYSEQTYNRIVNEVKEGTFNKSALPPIQVWGKSNELLAGYSRVKAFEDIAAGKHEINAKYKLSDFQSINTQVVVADTKDEAVKIAQESNQGAVQTDVDNANYVRNKILPGAKSFNAVMKKLRDLYGDKWRDTLSLARLNPDGTAIQTLKRLSSAGGDTKKNALKAAVWIGQAREAVPELTNAHENELFDWLVNKGGDVKNLSKIGSVDKFIDRVQKVGDYLRMNPEEPLNMDERVTKGPAQMNAESKKTELLQEQKDLLKEKKTASTEKRQNEITNRLGQLDKEIAYQNQQIAFANDYDKTQGALFDTPVEEPIDPETFNKLSGAARDGKLKEAFASLPESQLLTNLSDEDAIKVLVKKGALNAEQATNILKQQEDWANAQIQKNPKGVDNNDDFVKNHIIVAKLPNYEFNKNLANVSMSDEVKPPTTTKKKGQVSTQTYSFLKKNINNPEKLKTWAGSNGRAYDLDEGLKHASTPAIIDALKQNGNINDVQWNELSTEYMMAQSQSLKTQPTKTFDPNDIVKGALPFALLTPTHGAEAFLTGATAWGLYEAFKKAKYATDFRKAAKDWADTPDKQAFMKDKNFGWYKSAMKAKELINSDRQTGGDMYNQFIGNPTTDTSPDQKVVIQSNQKYRHIIVDTWNKAKGNALEFNDQLQQASAFIAADAKELAPGTQKDALNNIAQKMNEAQKSIHSKQDMDKFTELAIRGMNYKVGDQMITPQSMYELKVLDELSAQKRSFLPDEDADKWTKLLPTDQLIDMNPARYKPGFGDDFVDKWINSWNRAPQWFFNMHKTEAGRDAAKTIYSGVDKGYNRIPSELRTDWHIKADGITTNLTDAQHTDLRELMYAGKYNDKMVHTDESLAKGITLKDGKVLKPDAKTIDAYKGMMSLMKEVQNKMVDREIMKNKVNTIPDAKKRAAAIQKIKDDVFAVGGYFPLHGQGDYKVVAHGPDSHYNTGEAVKNVFSAKTEKEANDLATELQNKGYHGYNYNADKPDEPNPTPGARPNVYSIHTSTGLDKLRNFSDTESLNNIADQVRGDKEDGELTEDQKMLLGHIENLKAKTIAGTLAAKKGHFNATPGVDLTKESFDKNIGDFIDGIAHSYGKAYGNMVWDNNINKIPNADLRAKAMWQEWKKNIDSSKAGTQSKITRLGNSIAYMYSLAGNTGHVIRVFNSNFTTVPSYLMLQGEKLPSPKEFMSSIHQAMAYTHEKNGGVLGVTGKMDKFGKWSEAAMPADMKKDLDVMYKQNVIGNNSIDFALNQVNKKHGWWDRAMNHSIMNAEFYSRAQAAISGLKVAYGKGLKGEAAQDFATDVVYKACNNYNKTNMPLMVSNRSSNANAALSDVAKFHLLFKNMHMNTDQMMSKLFLNSFDSWKDMGKAIASQAPMLTLGGVKGVYKAPQGIISRAIPMAADYQAKYGTSQLLKRVTVGTLAMISAATALNVYNSTDEKKTLADHTMDAIKSTVGSKTSPIEQHGIQRFLMHGVMGILGIDPSNQTDLGNIFPQGANSDAFSSALGHTVQNLAQGVSYLKEGKNQKAAEKLLPSSIANPMEAKDWEHNGLKVDRDLTYKPTAWERWVKSFGLTPLKLSEDYAKKDIRLEKRKENRNRQR